VQVDRLPPVSRGFLGQCESGGFSILFFFKLEHFQQIERIHV